MTVRGLGAAFRAAPVFASGDADLPPRIDGLEAAVRVARGRLDPTAVDAAEAVVGRARGRLRVSTRHTVVAIAGATGSGKSTLFNALAGAPLSVSGPERPTTSTTTALVCGDGEVTDLLDWLGVPAAHRHRRAAAPAGTGPRLPAGVVLLDLPDHDSIAVAHHEEAERVVALADLLVWVVDPQKYADAALHHRMLQPHARHRDVMMVVLNHIDTVPDEQRAPMLRDVQQVVAADGIRDPLVLATSARTGLGVDELTDLVRRRVEAKHNVALRVRADLRTSVVGLEEAAGDAPVHVPDLWVADLGRRLAEASGVPGFVDRSRREVAAEVRQLLRWPLGAGAPRERALLRPPGPADRSAVEAAARDLADNICRDLSAAWADPVRTAATARLDAACDRLDAELAHPPAPALPDWLRLLAPARILLALCLLAGVVLLGTGAGPSLVPAALLGLGAVGVLGLQVAAGPVAERVARSEAAERERALRSTLSRLASEHVVGPVNAELASFRQLRRALETARS